MKARFFLSAMLFVLAGCAFVGIDARDNSIVEPSEEIERAETDYMTYLRLKKATSPMDSDYILLCGRLARDMVRDDLFQNNPERVKIAMRDILNYHPSAQIRLAVIHEYVEHALMNTRNIWIVDGSTPYDYLLDVELGEVTVQGDPDAREKGISAVFVLRTPDGDVVKEWSSIMKRSKGRSGWY